MGLFLTCMYGTLDKKVNVLRLYVRTVLQERNKEGLKGTIPHVKRLSEGVTNCAIIIAVNISLRTFFIAFYAHYESSVGDKSDSGRSR